MNVNPYNQQRLSVGDGFRFGVGFWLAALLIGLLPGILFWSAVAGIIGMAGAMSGTGTP